MLAIIFVEEMPQKILHMPQGMHLKIISEEGDD